MISISSLCFSIASPSISGLSCNKWDTSSSFLSMALAKEYIFLSFSCSEFQSITSLSSSESESRAGVLIARTGKGVSVVTLEGDWRGEAKFGLGVSRFLLGLSGASVSS